jgi:hypothetical protein
MTGEKNRMKQPILTDRSKYVHLPLWKRCTLVTTLLLTGGPLLAMATSQAAYAHTPHPTVPPNQTSLPTQTITIPAGTTEHIVMRFPSWQKNGRPKMNILRITTVCKDGGESGIAGTALFNSTGAAAGTPGSCTLTIPDFPYYIW